MAVIMEGKKSDKFKEFEDYCTKAYKLVRKQGYFLINIFMMMLSAGRRRNKKKENLYYFFIYLD